jgi:hypothetical protein
MTLKVIQAPNSTQLVCRWPGIGAIVHYFDHVRPDNPMAAIVVGGDPTHPDNCVDLLLFTRGGSSGATGGMTYLSPVPHKADWQLTRHAHYADWTCGGWWCERP